MRRLKRRRDRGAIAVLVALSMVALLGFTALGVDGGQIWSDRKQLQNGADAGALAIAQACATGNCGSYNLTADQYAKDNKFDGKASGTAKLDTGAGTVTVEAKSTRDLLFAPVIGIPTADIAATATARWRVISGGTFLPLTISLCAFYAQVGNVVGTPIADGTPMTIYYNTPLTGTASIDPKDVCGPDPGSKPPGGFSWIGDSNCSATVSVGVPVPSQTGNLGKGCTFGGGLVGQTIQFPVFDSIAGTGAGATYDVWGIASFVVTGYCFTTSLTSLPKGQCQPNEANQFLSGYFVAFTDLSGNWSTGSSNNNLGTDQVSLTK